MMHQCTRDAMAEALSFTRSREVTLNSGPTWLDASADGRIRRVDVLRM